MIEATERNGHAAIEEPNGPEAQVRRLEQNKKKAGTLVRQALREMLKIEEKLEQMPGKSSEGAGQICETLMDLAREVKEL